MGNLHASPFHCTRALPPLSHASAPVSSISPSTAAWLHSPKHACASVNDTAILQRPKPPNVASGIRARKGYLRLATCKRRRSEFRQINDIVSWVEQHVLQRLRGTRESAVERASRTREREREREQRACSSVGSLGICEGCGGRSFHRASNRRAGRWNIPTCARSCIGDVHRRHFVFIINFIITKPTKIEL